ncbi:MAG: hypothetical protein ACYC25_05495 [Paludibacter sp.]
MSNPKEIFKYPPIFLSSADSYSDIWDLFFLLFKKNWPEYNGIIYLNTQEKTIEVEGLNIVCTRLGHIGSFGKEMRACLEMIESDSVMLMLIDFIFMGKVNDQKIREYFIFFKEQDLDTLNFKYFNSINQKGSENPDLLYVSPPAPHVFFNYQIAFWKKNILKEMALPNENPWTSEWYGTKRAEKMNLKMAIVKGEVGSPINYHPSGCLAKGKWHPVSVDFLLKESIFVDFETRGFYNVEAPYTYKKRLQIKIMIVKAGLSGSYLDLLKRKSIH